MPTPSRSSNSRSAALVALLCLALAAPAGPAAAQPEPASAPKPSGATGPLCPTRLTSAQSADAPPGWTAERSARDAPLEAIALFDGPPARQVELAPAAGRRESGWQVAEWRFDRDTRPTLACRYRGTDIILTRALPVSVRACTLRTRAGSGLIDPTGLRCR